MKCPVCTNTKNRPSRFRSFDWLLLILLLRPYRCRSCGHRFWRFVFQR